MLLLLWMPCVSSPPKICNINTAAHRPTIQVTVTPEARRSSPRRSFHPASLLKDTHSSFHPCRQERMKIFPRGLAAFPRVPSSVEGFLARNLTTRPAFFGCTPSHVQGHAPGPLVVYIANGGPPRNSAAPLTNTSTTQTIYPESQLQGMLQQTFDVATQGMPSRGSDALVDREWGACLACAVVDRARARDGVKRSGVCESCFTRYCWEG
jgi:lysophospholipase